MILRTSETTNPEGQELPARVFLFSVRVPEFSLHEKLLNVRGSYFTCTVNDFPHAEMY